MNTQGYTHQFYITVTGKVQGVGYRAGTEEIVRRLGIVGWVRNSPDGSVQITATGTEEQLQALVAWCRQGPSGASVDHVSWDEQTPESFREFTVRR